MTTAAVVGIGDISGNHLQAIVDRLLAKEPEERFSSATELAEVLEHLLSRDATNAADVASSAPTSD